MQRILVDSARHKKRLKAGGDRQRVELSAVEPAIAGPSLDILSLDSEFTRRICNFVRFGTRRKIEWRHTSLCVFSRTCSGRRYVACAVGRVWAMKVAECLAEFKELRSMDVVLPTDGRKYVNAASHDQVNISRFYSNDSAYGCRDKSRESKCSAKIRPSTPQITIYFDVAGEVGLGRFELVDRIGYGAFGEVWTARDSELDRIVAVKIPRKSQLSVVEAEAFLREARSAAQQHHPNIVAVHEVGRQDDQIFIVGDLVKGITLADWLTGKRPTPIEAAELCPNISDAAQHAHEHSVIHRDLKPSNIMLDEDGQPRIMDFGLAKRDANEIAMTIDGRVLGTPAYMPPEQARGDAHLGHG